MASRSVGDPVREQLQTSLGAAYSLEGELGGGGMSRVFVATETRFGRRVVIKLLSPELAAAISVERFQREIAVAAGLQEPHIVSVITAGDADGLPWYSMPFVEGETLRARMQRGSITPREAVKILGDVARALVYAHARGIVHRDIKPENVLLTSGTAVVTDFGIAKAVSASQTRAATSDALTQVGMSIGTPAYMAPEQAAGDPEVDARADLYSWGVLAYELLSGAHPFAGKRSAQALIVAHLTEAPAPLDPEALHVPAELTALVQRCLAKDPEERPSSSASVVAELDALAIDEEPASARAASIAVLPFANMSADPDNEFFSDGITEDVITALTSVPGLRVAARTSAFAFKGSTADLATIGAKLGVRTVLQGSVRRAGNRVRVTAQLMNARDGFQLWSDRFDGDLEDIFAVQDEIARRIVQHMELTLGVGGTTTAPLVARPTEDLEAYQLYLRGREAVHQRTYASLQRGIQLLRQALARDPNYARAQLGLAEAFIGLGVYQYVPSLPVRHDAEEALEAAKRADPALPGLPFFRAQLKMYLRPDWPTAGEDLREALRLQPNDALTHAYAALWHGMIGQREPRARFVQRAAELDPLSPFLHAIGAMSYLVSEDYEEALAGYARGLALDPTSMVNLWQSGVALHRLGRYEESIDRCRRALAIGRAPVLVAVLAQSLASAGRLDEVRARRAELEARAAHEYVSPTAQFIVALALGETDRLEPLLREMIDAGTGPITIASTLVGVLDRVRAHPRLGSLVERLSLYAEPGKPSAVLSGPA